MTKFAKAVSFFLGPLFVLFPVPYILISKLSNDHIYALKWTIFSYGFVLATAFLIFLGVIFGVFTNFDVSKRKQRPLLFSLLAFSIFCYAISLFILNAPKVLFLGIFFIIIGLIAVVIVNRWIKASIHMATFVSVMLLIGILYKGYYFLFLTLAPLLAWSRIKTKGHTLIETIIGTALGVLTTLIMHTVTKHFLLGMIYN